jgi:hypothetical protein
MESNFFIYKCQKFSGFKYVRLKVGIIYSLTQLHMPEKQNILLCLSENIKNGIDFMFLEE